MPTRSSDSFLLRSYLISYNTLSAVGWSYVFVTIIVQLAGLTHLSQFASPTPTVKSTVMRFLRSIPFLKPVLWGGDIESSLPPWLLPVFDRAKTSFTAVGWQTAVVQSCAVLEIFHSLLGWVRSPITTTAMQVASRLILVWGIVDRYESVSSLPHPLSIFSDSLQTRYSPFYASMVLSWSITETIRYFFYAVNKLGYEPRWLLWLRYSTFYILYPTGAGSEAALIFSSLPANQNFSEGDWIRAILFLIWWPGLCISPCHGYMLISCDRSLYHVYLHD